MKRTWSILITTECYHPNFKGTKTEIKEFPIPEEVKNWLEVLSSNENKSGGLERTTANIVERFE